ncbi:MAG: hypothetical protein K1X67_26030 [Fimbriimonadaceae bacterium]|nr:hypothetical protein [Fimbriimonadaceae bacterium]
MKSSKDVADAFEAAGLPVGDRLPFKMRNFRPETPDGSMPTKLAIGFLPQGEVDVVAFNIPGKEDDPGYLPSWSFDGMILTFLDAKDMRELVESPGRFPSLDQAIRGTTPRLFEDKEFHKANVVVVIRGDVPAEEAIRYGEVLEAVTVDSSGVREGTAPANDPANPTTTTVVPPTTCTDGQPNGLRPGGCTRRLRATEEANIRAEPYSGSPSVDRTSAGRRYEVRCQKTGELVVDGDSGRSSDVWLNVVRLGWASALYFDASTAQIDECE